jgi:hypothetical protein
MSDDMTWCVNCDHVHPSTRDKEPWKWRCLRHPAKQGHGWVHPTWSPDPPYERCSILNNGNCEDFTPRRFAKPPIGEPLE